MEEIRIKVDIPAEFKKEFELALAEVIKQFVKNLELSMLQKRLESKEEEELIDWSVKLGRKAKKGRFKKLLKEISPERKEDLLKTYASGKIAEYEQTK